MSTYTYRCCYCGMTITLTYGGYPKPETGGVCPRHHDGKHWWIRVN